MEPHLVSRTRGSWSPFGSSRLSPFVLSSGNCGPERARGRSSHTAKVPSVSKRLRAWRKRKEASRLLPPSLPPSSSPLTQFLPVLGRSSQMASSGMAAKTGCCVRLSSSAPGEGHRKLLREGHPLLRQNQPGLAVSALGWALSPAGNIQLRATRTLSLSFLLPASVSLLRSQAPQPWRDLCLRGLPLCPRSSAPQG